MRDFVLFIDTEASGLPKNWSTPYSEPDNWPYNVQLAWVIYTKYGEEIKSENYYIGDDDFEISAEAESVHGITREFLKKHGKPRKEVLLRLVQDLEQYEPLLVGHFMQLDLHMLGVAFYRAGLRFSLNDYPAFCTMLATTYYSRNLRRRFLRLAELYRILFCEEMKHQHDALADARATARCFFELRQRGEIDDSIIAQQRLPKEIQGQRGAPLSGCFSVFLIIFVVIFSRIYWG